MGNPESNDFVGIFAKLSDSIMPMLLYGCLALRIDIIVEFINTVTVALYSIDIQKG